MNDRTYIALLRAINVGGRSLPMARLRALCEEIGWRNVRTYIQSGNVVFETDSPPRDAERDLEHAIAAEAGFDVPVIIRSAAAWRSITSSSPFRDVDSDDSKRVMAALAKASLAPDVESLILARAAGSERVRRVEDVIWIHFADGVARSRITPSLLDRAAGSPVTMRNVRTMERLLAMAEED